MVSSYQGLTCRLACPVWPFSAKSGGLPAPLPIATGLAAPPDDKDDDDDPPAITATVAGLSGSVERPLFATIIPSFAIFILFLRPSCYYHRYHLRLAPPSPTPRPPARDGGALLDGLEVRQCEHAGGEEGKAGEWLVVPARGMKDITGGRGLQQSTEKEKLGRTSRAVGILGAASQRSKDVCL